MEQSDIIQISKKYPQAFKSMDPNLIDRFFTKNVTKTGFLYDYESSNWTDMTTVGVLDLKNWVTDYNKHDIIPDSEIKIQILDLQEKIAVVKLEMDWAPNKKGCDYLFLIKEDTWLIDKILWQSTL
ncbi:nuclear transport factor 2 family protein [Flavivirga spongiicola]|uniref:Nuclear transport factor 2 family protein n=1 Tax=Flavivirga spongiicola TaxID=421621 RepID=A0ABU7XX14_9FLAO|nr:nuclear transport factor 2 family protein [Flavivirga sp. MEBiC05379]MDO5980316.1 nuclear transport factor 2 family protein [Flavivirga sp. MEBiC05379]